MQQDRTGRVLARTAPRDLTIADCREGDFRACVWCERRCPGRDLDLKTLERWADRKLVDLVSNGVIVCTRCSGFAVSIFVSSSERSDPILSWKIGDDAMPR